MGQILKGVFIMGPNGQSAIHIEAAVAPGDHVFDDRISDLAFGLKHLIAKEIFQVSWFRARCYLEYAVIGKATVWGDRVQMGVEILKFAESLNGDSGAGRGTVIGNWLPQVNAQYSPGTAG